MDTIQVQATLSAGINKVWDYWTLPEHIINWNFASDDWCCPHATNDLQPEGAFSWRMEAKDGSMGFDFKGTYAQINPRESIHLHLDDGRKVSISFKEKDNTTEVIEIFEPENMNDKELQRQGWQAILNNFKKYVEAN